MIQWPRLHPALHWILWDGQGGKGGRINQGGKKGRRSGRVGVGLG